MLLRRGILDTIDRRLHVLMSRHLGYKELQGQGVCGDGQIKILQDVGISSYKAIPKDASPFL